LSARQKDKKLKRILYNRKKSQKNIEKRSKREEIKNLLNDNTCEDCYWFRKVEWSTYSSDVGEESCDNLRRNKLLSTNEIPKNRTCKWWEWIDQYR